MKKFYFYDTSIPNSGFLTNRLQILTFIIPKKNPNKLLRILKVNMRCTWYMKKIMLLKNHFPVLVSYHESSSNGYSSFFNISKEDGKISKGGGTREREF